jgi:hypothetical protein
VADHLLKQITSGKWVNQAELARFVADQKIPDSLRKMIVDAVAMKLMDISRAAAKEAQEEYKAQTGKESPDTDGIPWEEAQEYAEIKAMMIADTIARDTVDQMVTISLAITAPTQDEVFALMDNARRELSMGVLDKIPPLVTSEVYARARAEEVAAIVELSGDDVEAIYYSAVLDDNTCEFCEQADTDHGTSGTPIVPGSKEEIEFMPPYQKCLGGVRCRCMFVYKYKVGEANA